MPSILDDPGKIFIMAGEFMHKYVMTNYFYVESWLLYHNTLAFCLMAFLDLKMIIILLEMITTTIQPNPTPPTHVQPFISLFILRILLNNQAGSSRKFFAITKRLLLFLPGVLKFRNFIFDAPVYYTHTHTLYENIPLSNFCLNKTLAQNL